MTEDERLVQILMAQRLLGPVFSLFGVVPSNFLIDPESEREKTFICECKTAKNYDWLKKFVYKDKDCTRDGKHPRRNGTRAQVIARASEKEVRRLFKKYSLGNLAIATGFIIVAIDVYVREDKNGVLSLARLEEGICLPA